MVLGGGGVLGDGGGVLHAGVFGHMLFARRYDFLCRVTCNLPFFGFI